MSSVSHRKESAVCPEGVCLSPLDELGGGCVAPPPPPSHSLLASRETQPPMGSRQDGNRVKIFCHVIKLKSVFSFHAFLFLPLRRR